MNEARLSQALAPLLGASLANDLSSNFVKIRTDHATKTLERASPGKFVEAFVQCLQQIATGRHDAKPSVDEYLRKVESEITLPEGLGVCAARVARAIYTLRNKRNVAHKGEVDPNTIDLGLAHHASVWIMSEMLRNATGLTMQKAGDLIAVVQTPVGSLVEEIDGVRLVLADVSVRVELLILLHSHYPERISQTVLLGSLSRRAPSTVKNRLRDLHNEKLVQITGIGDYKLTQMGYGTAVAEIRALNTAQGAPDA